MEVDEWKGIVLTSTSVHGHAATIRVALESTSKYWAKKRLPMGLVLISVGRGRKCLGNRNHDPFCSYLMAFVAICIYICKAQTNLEMQAINCSMSKQN